LLNIAVGSDQSKYLLKQEQLNKISFQKNKADSNKNIEEEQQENIKTRRRDAFAEMPIRALGYTNELGEAIRPLSPILANLSWLPAIAYIGADVADKYKQDEYGDNTPSKRRASKQLATQLLASVFLPTGAVKIGQGVVNNVASFSKKGLTLGHRESISDIVLNSMNGGEHKEFLNAEGKVDKALYKESLAGKLDEIVKHKRTHKKLLEPFYSVVDFIKRPLIKTPKTEKIKEYAGAVVDRLVDARQNLLDGVKPENMSEKAFNKFMSVAKNASPEEKQSIAFDAIRKMEKGRMFNNRVLKSIGGLLALSMLAKPIDKFVEHVVIGKMVGPAIDNVATKHSTNNTSQT
jgi:hypothetical protein